MALSYTNDDFVKAMGNAGLSRANFSDADWDMSMNDPTFGMSLISAKKDYASATTEEARALANERANALRRSYGGYSGGEDGGSFIMNSKRQRQIDDLTDEMANYAPFSYDPEDDPVFGSYKKTYLREGDRAAKNALGVAASATGGRPSSYAVTAASQANDYYASKLSDVIPQLYDQAYNRYLNEFNRKRSMLSDLKGLEEAEYGRFVDDLDRRRQDEERDYTRRWNEENRDYERSWNEENRDYERAWNEDARTYDRAMDDKKLGLDIWGTSGYMPEAYAGALGVEAGTPTASQALTDEELRLKKELQAHNIAADEIELCIAYYKEFGRLPDRFQAVIDGTGTLTPYGVPESAPGAPAAGGAAGEAAGNEYLLALLDDPNVSEEAKTALRNLLSTAENGVAGAESFTSYGSSGAQNIGTDDQVIYDVIAGKYGNGEARRTALRAAGYDPDAVQAGVNRVMGVYAAPKGSDGGSRFPKDTPAADDSEADEYSAAARAFLNDDDQSDEVIRAMLDEGYTKQELFDNGYKGTMFDKPDGSWMDRIANMSPENKVAFVMTMIEQRQMSETQAERLLDASHIDPKLYKR